MAKTWLYYCAHVNVSHCSKSIFTAEGNNSNVHYHSFKLDTKTNSKLSQNVKTQYLRMWTCWHALNPQVEHRNTFFHVEILIAATKTYRSQLNEVSKISGNSDCYVIKTVSLTGCVHQWQWRPCRAAGTCSARWPGSSQQPQTSVPWWEKSSCAERWRWPTAACHHWSLDQHLQRQIGHRSEVRTGAQCGVQVHVGDSLCSPLGRSMVLRTSSVTSDDRRPFNLLSQNSCRQDTQMLSIIYFIFFLWFIFSVDQISVLQGWTV